jgi:hypothetical protein
MPTGAIYVFDQLPIHDTCWAMIAGADDRVYIAACCEMTGGVGVYLVRFDPRKKSVDCLFDIAEAVGEPATNGRATQCKIHYSLMASSDGMIYGATHLSGPPAGDFYYSPWASWRESRSFIGSMIFAFDTRTDQVLWTDMCYPLEGSRSAGLDEVHGQVYGVGYPRDHFWAYKLEARETVDLGRIGSVNPLVVWTDPAGNGYTADDDGMIIRCNGEKLALECLDVFVPHAPYQGRFHCTVYDLVAAPDDPWTVYGVNWKADPWLFRYRMSPTGPGEMTALGPIRVTGGPEPGSYWNSQDHAAGLVFDNQGRLNLFANSVADYQTGTCIVHHMVLDPATGEQQDLGILDFDGHRPRYIPRAARTRAGELVLADVGGTPTRAYCLPAVEGPFINLPIRTWG